MHDQIHKFIIIFMISSSGTIVNKFLTSKIVSTYSLAFGISIRFWTEVKVPFLVPWFLESFIKRKAKNLETL